MAKKANTIQQISLGLHQNKGGRPNMEDRIDARYMTTAAEMPLLVAMVADGIGGHNCGEVAAELAISTTFYEIENASLDNPAQLPQLLAYALKKANDVVYQEARASLEKKGMGTTATVVAIQQNKLYLANVGDSRAYLVRDGRALQLTQDHTWAREMIHLGRLTPAEAEAHPKGGALIRSIGYSPEIAVDLGLYVNGDEDEQRARQRQGFSLETGDCLLLCSDGLIKDRPGKKDQFVNDEEIAKIISRNDAEKAAQLLVKKALSRKADDNVSAIVLKMPDSNKSGSCMLTAVRALLGLFLIILLALFGFAVLFREELIAQSSPQPSPAVQIIANSTAVSKTMVPIEAASSTPSPIEVKIIGPKSNLFLDGIPLAEQEIYPNQELKSGAGVSQINLGDDIQIYLDAGTIIKFILPENDKADIIIELQNGWLIVLTNESTVIVNSLDYQASLKNGLTAIYYRARPFSYAVHCLKQEEADGEICKFRENDEEEIEITLGSQLSIEKRKIATRPADYATPNVIAPSIVPSPTPTVTPTLWPTATPRPTLAPTRTPTTTSTPEGSVTATQTVTATATLTETAVAATPTSTPTVGTPYP